MKIEIDDKEIIFLIKERLYRKINRVLDGILCEKVEEVIKNLDLEKEVRDSVDRILSKYNLKEFIKK